MVWFSCIIYQQQQCIQTQTAQTHHLFLFHCFQFHKKESSLFWLWLAFFFVFYFIITRQYMAFWRWMEHAWYFYKYWYVSSDVYLPKYVYTLYALHRTQHHHTTHTHTHNHTTTLTPFPYTRGLQILPLKNETHAIRFVQLPGNLLQSTRLFK